MVDMINFLKYHGAKIYNGKKIYLNSIPSEDFPIFISRGEYNKAYFDIKEKKFCGLSWKYGEDLKAKAEEEKEQIEEWIKEQEAKQAEAMTAKTESKPQNEELNKLKAIIEKNRDKEKAKGFYSLCLLICEKFNFKAREAVNKTIEAINHGISYFTLKDETLKEKIIKDSESQKYLTENLIPLISKQINKVNNFDDLLAYVFTGDFEEMSKDVISFICREKTEEQKANEESKEESITGESSKPLATVDNKPQRSESQKRADEKYNSSDKGKESQRKYRESEKGKAIRANYLKSEQGKQAREKANRKYRESEKGQQSQKQAYNKYKDSEKGKQARLKAVRAYRERQKEQKQNMEVIK